MTTRWPASLSNRQALKARNVIAQAGPSVRSLGEVGNPQGRLSAALVPCVDQPPVIFFFPFKLARTEGP